MPLPQQRPKRTGGLLPVKEYHNTGRMSNQFYMQEKVVQYTAR